jgi:predicted ABC-type ATPase
MKQLKKPLIWKKFLIKPQLWIVAGPNGSGKSTLIAKYLPIFKDRVELINPIILQET